MGAGIPVSVIVPVYNVRRYLAQCLDSILDQTFTDFELLLIDDGSEDGSGTICDAYAAKDGRVRTIHQENAGASAARNRGLDEARGQYVMFVDSDDYIDPDCLERALSDIRDSHADLYISGLVVETFEEGRIVCEEIKAAKGKRMYGVKDFLNDMDIFYPNGCINPPVCKLYERGMLEAGQIRFQRDISLGEDLLFNQRVLLRVDTVFLSDEVHYHYRKERTDSLSTRYDPKHYEMLSCVYGQMRDLLYRKGCDAAVKHRFEYIYFYVVLQGIIRCYRDRSHCAAREEALATIDKVARDPDIKGMSFREVKRWKHKPILLLLKLRMIRVLDLLMRVLF